MSERTEWNFDMTAAPRDGRWILILTEFDEPACVYWPVGLNGEEFGWTYDGGDRFEPKAWCRVTDQRGQEMWP